MAKLTRKQLKQDKFVEEVGHQVEWFSEHQKPVIVGAIVAIAVVIGSIWFVGYHRARAEEANAELQEAVRVFGGAVTTESRPGFVTFATTGERQRRVTEAFEKVLADFPGSDAAAAAQYYLGLLDLEQDKYDDAQKKLETAVDSADKEYTSLARLALASTLASKGDIAAAREQYEKLIASPTDVVPAERAKLELARKIADSDPQGARTILLELAAQGGAVGLAANQELRLLPAGA